jgi:hypothetical protein
MKIKREPVARRGLATSEAEVRLAESDVLHVFTPGSQWVNTLISIFAGTIASPAATIMPPKGYKPYLTPGHAAGLWHLKFRKVGTPC